MKEIVQYMVVSVRGDSLFSSGESSSATGVVTTVSSSPHGTRTEVASRITTTTTRYAPEAPSANVGYVPSPSVSPFSSPSTSPRASSPVGDLSTLFEESNDGSSGSDYEPTRGRYEHCI